MKPDEGARHLFVYGTLVDTAQVDAVLGHRYTGERLAARLRGYRRVTTPSFGYFFLVVDPESFVDGVLIMDVSPYDMQVLDRYEEVESGIYRREPVQVEAWGCGPNALRIAADVYVGGAALESSTTR